MVRLSESVAIQRSDRGLGSAGAVIFGGLDLFAQLATNGWNIKCVNWTQVGVAGAVGSIGVAHMAVHLNTRCRASDSLS